MWTHDSHHQSQHPSINPTFSLQTASKTCAFKGRWTVVITCQVALAALHSGWKRSVFWHLSDEPCSYSSRLRLQQEEQASYMFPQAAWPRVNLSAEKCLTPSLANSGKGETSGMQHYQGDSQRLMVSSPWGHLLHLVHSLNITSMTPSKHDQAATTQWKL